MTSAVPNLFVPIDFLCTSNDFAPMKSWVITDNGPITLWAQLERTDSLGTRRWISTDSTATVSLRFQRAAPVNLYNYNHVAQTFDVVGTYLTGDQSMFSFDLTAAQVHLLTSGTVQLIYTTGTLPNVVVTILNQNYMLSKSLNSAGC